MSNSDDAKATAQEWDKSIFRNPSIDEVLNGLPPAARERYDRLLEEEISRDPREAAAMPASARALVRWLEPRSGR